MAKIYSYNNALCRIFLKKFYRSVYVLFKNANIRYCLITVKNTAILIQLSTMYAVYHTILHRMIFASFMYGFYVYFQFSVIYQYEIVTISLLVSLPLKLPPHTHLSQTELSHASCFWWKWALFGRNITKVLPIFTLLIILATTQSLSMLSGTGLVWELSLFCYRYAHHCPACRHTYILPVINASYYWASALVGTGIWVCGCTL